MCDVLHGIHEGISMLVKSIGLELKPIEPLKLDWMEDVNIFQLADEFRSLDDDDEFHHNMSGRNHSIDDGIEVG